MNFSLQTVSLKTLWVSGQSIFSLTSGLLGTIYGLMGLVRGLMKFTERRIVTYKLNERKLEYFKRRLTSRRNLMAMMRYKETVGCFPIVTDRGFANEFEKDKQPSPTSSINESTIYTFSDQRLYK